MDVRLQEGTEFGDGGEEEAGITWPSTSEGSSASSRALSDRAEAHRRRGGWRLDLRTGSLALSGLLVGLGCWTALCWASTRAPPRTARGFRHEASQLNDEATGDVLAEAIRKAAAEDVRKGKMTQEVADMIANDPNLALYPTPSPTPFPDFAPPLPAPAPAPTPRPSSSSSSSSYSAPTMPGSVPMHQETFVSTRWTTGAPTERPATPAPASAVHSDAGGETSFSVCADDGGVCSGSRCCRQPSDQCFERSPGRALCSSSCDPSAGLAEPAGQAWSCKVLTSTSADSAGYAAPSSGVQAAAYTPASAGASSPSAGTDATGLLPVAAAASTAAAVAGTATSAPATAAGSPSTTPIPASAIRADPRDEHGDHCAEDGQDCRRHGCCKTQGASCFSKTNYWAQCLEDCVPGVHEEDSDDDPWSCKIRRPIHLKADEHPVTAPTSYTSIFCFSVVRKNSGEVDLVRSQLQLPGGIFSCDDFMVFSDATHEELPDIPHLYTLALTDRNAVAGALTATWVNADEFIAAWARLIDENHYSFHDWTLKADPDAVFLAPLLIKHLEQFSSQLQYGAGIYLKNCRDGPRALELFGSVEIVSTLGVTTLGANRDQCTAMEHSLMGEDLWLQQCLMQIGVQGVEGYSLLADGYCPTSTDASRCTPPSVAFHPMKTSGQWIACFSELENAGKEG